VYRDLWRVHVLAAISLVACTGLCFNAFRTSRPWAGFGWLIGALAAAGVLAAPIVIRRAAEKRNPPPGRHSSGNTHW
jgi:hypothetical protein